MFILLKKILFLLGKDKSKLFLIIILFLLSSLMDVVSLSIIGPYIGLLLNLNLPEIFNFFLKFITTISFLKSYDSIVIVSFFILFLFLAKLFFIIFVNKLVIKFGLEQMFNLRLRLTKLYQNLPYVESQDHNQSKYITNLTTIVSEYSQILIAMLRAFGDILVSVLIIIFLAMQNLLAIVILLILVFLVIVNYYYYFKNKLLNYGKNINDASDGLVKGIQETIKGIKEIRILGKENYFYDKIKNNSIFYIKFSEKIQLIQFMPRYILEFTLVLFIISISLIALLNSADLRYLMPILSTFAVSALRLFPSVSSLLSGTLLIKSKKDSVDRIYRDIIKYDNTRPVVKIKNNISQQHLQNKIHAFKNIELRNVSYKYPSSDFYIFKFVNLEILSKEMIGIKGESGSGKSTLIDIILGLIDPTEGIVFYNRDKVLNNMDYIIKNVAYIPQESFLIDSTIEENISLESELSEKKRFSILKSLDKSNLSNLIKKLPLGTKTLIGENGVKFSGGERQRLALARSFYHNRDILVLDEATSALDSETEDSILSEIKKLKSQKTVIIISHNEKFFHICDKIFEIKNNTVIRKK